MRAQHSTTNLVELSADRGFVRKSCPMSDGFSVPLMTLSGQSFPSHMTSEFLWLRMISWNVAQEESVSSCSVNTSSSSFIISYSRKLRYATDISLKKVMHMTPTNKHVSTMTPPAFLGALGWYPSSGHCYGRLWYLESHLNAYRHLRSPNLSLEYRILARAFPSSCRAHCLLVLAQGCAGWIQNPSDRHLGCLMSARHSHDWLLQRMDCS